MVLHMQTTLYMLSSWAPHGVAHANRAATIGGHHMVLHMQTSIMIELAVVRAPYGVAHANLATIIRGAPHGVAQANLAFVIILITAHMGGHMRHPIGCCLRTAG